MEQAEVKAGGPFRHCPECGAPETGRWAGGREFRCRACGFRFFQNVATACGVLAEHDGRFLFVERAREPSRGKLGLPGGFVDPGERVEEALVRELREETGGTVGPVTFVASFPNRYVFAGVEYHTCDLYFRAALVGSPDALKADPDEVSALLWLRLDEVRDEELAFPSLRALWTTLRRGGVSQ